MTHWKCSNCAYTFEAEAPPDNCPSCKEACTFSDVTCYIPECGRLTIEGK
jgi:rubredoxin